MRDDVAVSSVLGAVLVLALMLTLVPGAVMMRAAVSDEMEAQREAAELAAFCARNPAIGPPTCDARGPLPGYACQETQVDVWVCTRPSVPTVSPPVPSTPPTVSSSPVVPSLGS